jgi:hypothetical protein
MVFRCIPPGHEEHYGRTGRREERECPLDLSPSRNASLALKRALTILPSRPEDADIFSFLSGSSLS